MTDKNMLTGIYMVKCVCLYTCVCVCVCESVWLSVCVSVCVWVTWCRESRQEHQVLTTRELWLFQKLLQQGVTADVGDDRAVWERGDRARTHVRAQLQHTAPDAVCVQAVLFSTTGAQICTDGPSGGPQGELLVLTDPLPRWVKTNNALLWRTLCLQSKNIYISNEEIQT